MHLKYSLNVRDIDRRSVTGIYNVLDVVSSTASRDLSATTIWEKALMSLEEHRSLPGADRTDISSVTIQFCDILCALRDFAR